MKKIILIFVVTMLVSIVARAEEVPDISGLWTASNGSAFNIKQDGKKVRWKLQDGGFNYVAEGKWKADRGYFSVAIEREAKSNGCVTWLKVSFTPLTDSKAQFEESAMDQNCDLKIGYKNSFTLQKND